MSQHRQAALALHSYLTDKHWVDGALIGPDPGIRLNYRFGRFIKSYLPSLPWRDSLYYVQGQGYWVLANWRLYEQTGNTRFREIATAGADRILAHQRADGAWEYPNPEWRGRIATAEGTWGALGLLESYRHTRDTSYLASVQRWHSFLTQNIGFQQQGDTLAVNYFAGRTGNRVPNNSAFVLRLLAELADTTGDDTIAQPCGGMIAFLQLAQQPSGEFPYTVEGAAQKQVKPHFQCFQYNAFICLDLARYYQVSNDAAARPLIEGVLRFLRSGVHSTGRAFYECGNRHREVTYHTAALAAAFAKAGEIGIAGYDDLAERTYGYLLRRQRHNGSFPYSRRDYRILSDRRSYPRYLAMILYHLLSDQVARGADTLRKEIACGSAR